MGSYCPYCGAVLKLKFCAVCGRQSQLNKMGNLRNTARNTDATARLEDPFAGEEDAPKQSSRFHRKIKPIIETLIGIFIVVALIFCTAKEALDLSSSTLNDIVLPWIKNHRFTFPYNWPSKVTLIRHRNRNIHKIDQNIKRQPRNKSNEFNNK